MSFCRFFSSLTVMALFLSSPAYASKHVASENRGIPEEETFDQSSRINDETLGNLRGGFMNMQGVMIDFSFLSRVTVDNVVNNVHEMHEISLSSNDIPHLQQISSAEDAGSGAAVLPAAITVHQIIEQTQPLTMVVQNSLSDSIITVNRSLDIVVTGAMDNALFAARMNALENQNISSLR